MNKPTLLMLSACLTGMAVGLLFVAPGQPLGPLLAWLHLSCARLCFDLFCSEQT